MSKKLDLVGNTYGRLLVVERDEAKVGKHSYFICQCSCGNVVPVRGTQLVQEITKSCGCLKNAPKHGMRGTKTYRKWDHMKSRCNSLKNSHYKYYGERGITYDPKWETFEGFFEDMGECPPNLTIERKNVNGNYCKENCEWADDKTQANNKTNNRFLTYNGKRQTIAQWADEIGIARSAIWQRIFRGKWPIEKALTIPSGKCYR
jgi:hypothetical protein